MKKSLIASALLSLSIVASYAQTNSIWTDVEQVAQDMGLSSNPTNYAGAIFVGKSVSGTNRWAEGLVITENVNNNIGICGGFDTLQGGGKIGSANIVSGGLTLKAPMHPLSFISTNSFCTNLTLIPYVIAMVATPINGTGSSDGGLGSIERAGGIIDITEFGGWKLSLGADYGSRSGSGAYNGNYIDGVLAIRKGF